MAIDTDLARKNSPSTDRVETNNKVQLDNGVYDATILDVWVHYVDIDGKFTKNKADAIEQRAVFKVGLDGSETVLKHDMPIRIGKKTFYSKTVETLAGITDRDQHLNFDPTTLKGLKCDATVVCEEKISKRTPEHSTYIWSSITDLVPQNRPKVRPQPRAAAAPPQQSAHPAAEDDSWPSEGDMEVPF